ncbi:hypothetical protein FBR02_07145 [Anaerolineae bacterium CFX9]|nr:hypothetical protein [Anaerolineae bacterium CFX9]
MDIPSETILKYGKPIADSYYKVEQGQLILDESSEQCSFEVMYSDNGEIYVVCSFASVNEYLRVFSVPNGDGTYSSKDTYTTFRELRGQVATGNMTIVVRNGIELNAPNLSTVAVFVAEVFTVSVSAQSILDANGSIAVFAYEFKCTNIPSSFHQRFEISQGKAIQLRGLPLVSDDEIAFYDPFATLTVSDDALFGNWQAEDIATLFCALMSLALGRDIRWIAKQKFSPEQKVVERTYQRHRNLNLSERIRPILQEFPLNLFGSVQFVETAFGRVAEGRITLDAALDYAESIRHFVEYSLLTRRLEDQARLIGTALEELLLKWEKHSSSRGDPVVNQEEADALYKLIKPTIRQFVEEHNLDEPRASALRERINGIFSNEITRPTFRARLEFLFRSVPEIGEWVERVVKPRLSRFIRTRDNIVHNGQFPSSLGIKNHNDPWEDYLNMVMMLPFMIFAIIGYTGGYIDHYERYVKRKSSEQEE